MKFLIGASFLCIALFGQTQGGSLRGLSVIVPHQQYGVPLLSSEIHHQAEEIKPESPKQEESTTSAPFIDHLPFVDSAVNFGYPSGKPASPIKPVTEKPELPILELGLPSLPAAPIIPAKIEEPIQAHVVPSNSYLPPAGSIVTVNQELSSSYLPPNVELPILQATPILPQAINQGFSHINFAHVQPAASFVPLSVYQPIQELNLHQLSLLNEKLEAQPIQNHIEPSNNYLPQKPELPLLQPGLPSLPEAPKVPLTIAIEQPVQAQAELPNTYLPPKPELPLLQPGLPALPEAPTVPLTIAIEEHIQTKPEVSNTYLPPKPELPLLQPGLPSLPEAPKVPLTIAIEQPAQVELPNTYLPPKLELPLLQPGLPSLPEAPKVPLIIAIEQPAQAELSNTYLPPKQELSLLQPGLPSFPEAPKFPLTIAFEQPIQAQPEVFNNNLPPQPQLPLLQPGLPALPEAPIVPDLPKISEIPALPEASVVPAPAPEVDESKIGYNYEKPALAFPSSASQLPIVEEIKVEPIVQAQQPISQIHIAPGYISSQYIDISQASHIQPPQQVLVQPAQQVVVQHTQQTQQHIFVPHPIQEQLQAQQLLLSQPFPAQQALAEPSISILPVVNKAPTETHHGYNYNAPKVEFLLPNRY